MNTLMPMTRPIPMARSPWRPAPMVAGASPFDWARNPKALAQAGSGPSGSTVWDHPAVSLALDASAAALGAIGTAKFTGFSRALAWGVLIGAGVRGIVDLVRLFNIVLGSGGSR